MKRGIWTLLKRIFRRSRLEDIDRVLLEAYRRHIIDSRQLHILDAALKYGASVRRAA